MLDAPFLGTKRLLVIVVGLQDAPPLFEVSPAGESELLGIVETALTACETNSQGLLTLQLDHTWPPLAIQKLSSDYDRAEASVRIRADAIEAARLAGYAPEQYDREVIFSPPAVFGSSRAHARVRTVWMPNKLPFVLYHELGHTLGWGHANFWNGDPLAVPQSGAPEIVDYGDLFDPMGTGQDWTEFHHSGPWFKARAGWLSAPDVALVTSPGSWTLSDLEAPDAGVGPVALRIRRDADLDYWIFHRADEPLVSDGIVIVSSPSNPFDASLLLDMQRGVLEPGQEAEDAALQAGQAFEDPLSGVLVRNASPPGGPPTVEVQVDPARQLALDRRPLIEVVHPPRDQGPIAGLVPFEVTAADPDVGSTDGEGIAKLTLAILDNTQDPFPILEEVELFQRPYRWLLDTTTLPDAPLYLSVTAEALDGGTRTIWFGLLVDNGSGGG